MDVMHLCELCDLRAGTRHHLRSDGGADLSAVLCGRCKIEHRLLTFAFCTGIAVVIGAVVYFLNRWSLRHDSAVGTAAGCVGIALGLLALIVLGMGVAGLVSNPAKHLVGEADRIRTLGYRRGIQLLVDCDAPDNLSPDETYDEAIASLQEGKEKASRRLAKLILEQMYSRTEGITYSLRAAANVPPVPELVEALQAVLASSPVRHGDRGRFVPEIESGVSVGWTDRTHARVQELARKALP